jgi:fused signal recognition particle receptor
LQSIRDAKAAKKKAQAESDKKEQAAAKPELARRDAEKAAAVAAEAEEKAAKEKEESDRKQAGLVKERLALEKDIAEARKDAAEREEEGKRGDIEGRWTKELEKANTLADELRDKLEKRTAMGAVDSPEFKRAMIDKMSTERRIERIQKAREKSGMGRLSEAMVEGLDDAAMKEEEIRLRLNRSLGIKGPQGEAGKTAEEIEAIAKKQGRKLSKSALEALRRGDLRSAVQREVEAKKVAQNNLDELKRKDELAWQAKLLKENVDAAVSLKLMEDKLDTLLQAAP